MGRKGWFKLILALILVGGVLYLGIRIYDTFLSKKSYIEEVTQIKFPSGTSTVEEFDNYEFAIVGKYIVPESSIEKFIDENLLEPFNGNNFYFGFAESLQWENRIHHSGAIFYGIQDCNQYNYWTFVIDKETGELWIQVGYADFSGDLPTCDKLQ